MVSAAPGCIQGSLAVPSSFQEWMENRGMKTLNCTQRTNSSGSGFAPAKPPTSWPMLETPDKARPSPILTLYFSVFHEVALSPDQVCT